MALIIMSIFKFTGCLLLVFSAMCELTDLGLPMALSCRGSLAFYVEEFLIFFHVS